MTTRRINHLQTMLGPLLGWLSNYNSARAQAGPDACDFAFGNPHDMPLPGFGPTLAKHAAPEHKDWYAYKTNEAASQAHVARTLQARMGVAFEPENISMTNGAAGALHIAFNTILDPGDEVIINLPPWFLYESFIAAAGGVTVKVPVKADDYDLDVAAIAAAITPRTRAVVVNSPNNPTGRIYAAATLQALAAALSEASARHGRPIYLISDEAYNRILFDGRPFISPTLFYPNSLLIYTYGKTLLTPGQRLGYIALPPGMPGRVELHQAIELAQFVNGFGFPSALMQYAMPDLENQIIDLELLQEKRDRMVGALRRFGYEMRVPEGTFYLLVRSPQADDAAFVQRLIGENIFCLPGSVCEIPGHFRISLTANEGMIERALPGFARAIAATG